MEINNEYKIFTLRTKSWIHNVLINKVYYKNKPLYEFNENNKKIAHEYNKILNSNVKDYKKLNDLYKQYIDIDDKKWKHKFYMGHYCNPDGTPLYKNNVEIEMLALYYQNQFN